MTKLQNMKIRINNPEHSKQVQECLFKLGFGWGSNLTTTPENTSARFLYSNTLDNTVTWGDTYEHYQHHKYKEVTLEDLQLLIRQRGKPANSKQTTFSELQELVSTTNIELTFQTNGKVHIYDNDTDTGKEFDNVESAVLLLKAKAEYLKEWNK